MAAHPDKALRTSGTRHLSHSVRQINTAEGEKNTTVKMETEQGKEVEMEREKEERKRERCRESGRMEEDV